MKDPIALFQDWLQEAVDSGLKEPSAMTVATVSPAVLILRIGVIALFTRVLASFRVRPEGL